MTRSEQFELKKNTNFLSKQPFLRIHYFGMGHKALSMWENEPVSKKGNNGLPTSQPILNGDC